MKKKDVVGAFLFLVITLCLSYVTSAQNIAQSDDKEVFEKRLSRFFSDIKTMSESSPLNSNETEKAVKSAKYPRHFPI